MLLRSLSIAGRRVDKNGRTVHTYEPIITWEDHQRLVARLDSRANRQGMSPGNVALLTGVLFDAEGNKMYRITGWNGVQYYSRKSKVGVDLAEMDTRVGETFAGNQEPFLVPQLVPGDNHVDEIARLRQDRAELDDLAPDYDERHAELTERIRELAREDAENPSPDRVELVDSGKTYGEVWRELSTAERRDMLLARNVRVTCYGGDEGWGMEFPEEAAAEEHFAGVIADVLTDIVDQIDPDLLKDIIDEIDA